MGGGDDAGGGGWFSGGWLRGFNGDHFWQEAQQASLALLGIIFMYLVIAKGEALLAIVFNPMLFALRSTRNGFAFLTSLVSRKISPVGSTEPSIPVEVQTRISAKESVIRKWGSD
ncbi:hypothetical protein GIB67_014150 [Kingdonia uniflora]|uniref:Uncharacterized protein n=1 Tax=Kingdonia uniflora TaxID=39325 RepID=A0A7J7N4W3_9MAGN|nr:hypothetical protein GIB67_014150 [Kingdonia uniflora]